MNNRKKKHLTKTAAAAATCMAVVGTVNGCSTTGGGGVSVSSPHSSSSRISMNKKDDIKNLIPNTIMKLNEIRGGGGNNNNNECYYEILGVSRQATSIELKKAYRRKAVQTHPDKMPNGDRSQFDLVSEAYDVLSSDEKRSIYDRFGKSGLENGNSSAASSASEVFRHFFGHGDPFMFGGTNVRRKPRNMKFSLEVTLEELYTGITKQVSMPISNNNKRTEKKMSVDIPKGSLSGSKIIMPGEIDFLNNHHHSGGGGSSIPPGDAIFILSQRPHPVYTRKNSDLAMEMEITLSEAVCGFKRQFQHLDGKVMDVSLDLTDIIGLSDKGEEKEGMDMIGRSNSKNMIQSNDVYVIQNKGMPLGNADGDFGDLYIQLKVVMPHETKKKASFSSPNNDVEEEALTISERKELARLLNKLYDTNPTNNNIQEEKEDQHQTSHQRSLKLKKAKASEFGKSHLEYHKQKKRNEQSKEESYLHTEEEDDDAYHRSRSSSFFSTGSGFHPFGAAGATRSFFSSSFGGNRYHGDADEENIQCQQM